VLEEAANKAEELAGEFAEELVLIVVLAHCFAAVKTVAQAAVKLEHSAPE